MVGSDDLNVHSLSTASWLTSTTSICSENAGIRRLSLAKSELYGAAQTWRIRRIILMLLLLMVLVMGQLRSMAMLLAPIMRNRSSLSRVVQPEPRQPALELALMRSDGNKTSVIERSW